MKTIKGTAEWVRSEAAHLGDGLAADDVDGRARAQAIARAADAIAWAYPQKEITLKVTTNRKGAIAISYTLAEPKKEATRG